MSVTPLERLSAVDELAAALRARILDGELAGGTRLPEADVCATYVVARHTARAALRALAAEGLVVVEPHRGARVAALDAAQVEGLFELRAALEVEAVRLALERSDGRLPAPVHAAVRALGAACRRRRPAWSAVVVAHEAVHAAIVAAAASPRIAAAHAALAQETRLFLVQLPPAWTPERMAADHEALPAALEAGGPEAMRAHLRESAGALLDELAAR